MFPGLDALGAYVAFIFTAVCSAIGCMIFNIVRLIKKKRAIAGKKGWGKRLVKIYDLINVVLVIVAVIFLVVCGIDYSVDAFKKHNHQVQLSKNEEYRKQVLEELKESERYNKAIYDDPEQQLCYEAYSYSLYVEYIPNNNNLEEGSESFGVTEINEEVLKQGRENYVNFTRRYNPIRGVEKNNQELLFEEASQTVSVSSELYCVDEKNNSTVDACMVVVFDKEWRVADIYCQEEKLNQYVPY